MDYILERLTKAILKAIANNNEKKSVKSLYLLIHNEIQDAIVQKNIPEGTSLPSTRNLSKSLKVSRSTIIKSYELLRLEGYIDSKSGSGHEVKHVLGQEKINKPEENTQNKYTEISKLGESFLGNISLINSTDDKSIAFRPGLPPLDVFPVNQWKNLSNSYWRYIKSSSLSYSPSSGIEQLKRNIGNYLNLVRGIKCKHQQIIIVSGSLQSLFLTGAAVLNKGDKVAMENPTFPNVYSSFKGLGAEVKGVGLDKEGFKVSELKGYKPKLIHVTPSCHYPTSVPMSLKRKKALLQFANKTGAFVIENDYEHEISNWQAKSDTLFDLDKENRVIYMGTFNRLLHPSIRIGYMIAPPHLQTAIEAIMKHSHRFVSPAIQVVLNEFIEKKHIYYHIKNVVEAAEERKTMFKNIFENSFNGSIELQKQQKSHLQFLAHLKHNENDKSLSNLFAQNNIIAHQYSKCFIENNNQTEVIKPEQGLILGYASVRTPFIKRKLIQMEKVYKSK